MRTASLSNSSESLAKFVTVPTSLALFWPTKPFELWIARPWSSKPRPLMWEWVAILASLFEALAWAAAVDPPGCDEDEVEACGWDWGGCKDEDVDAILPRFNRKDNRRWMVTEWLALRSFSFLLLLLLFSPFSGNHTRNFKDGSVGSKERFKGIGKLQD